MLHDVTRCGQQLVAHSRVGGRTIGVHFGRCWVVLNSTGGEPRGGLQISLFGHENVDDLVQLIERSVQIDPSFGDFDVCFVDEPPVAGC